jgi:hypothetical protein
MHRLPLSSPTRLARLPICGLLLLALLAIATPAAAETTLEGFVGYYDPDSVDDNAEIFGGRIGWKNSENFGILISLGAIDLEDDLLEIEDEDLQFGLLLADVSFQWYPTGNNFYVFAGAGYADIGLEIDLPGDNNDIDENEGTLTANGGVGYRWDFGETWFVRFEGKARWFEGGDFASDDDFEFDSADSYDGLDTEYTAGFGWRF